LFSAVLAGLASCTAGPGPAGSGSPTVPATVPQASDTDTVPGTSSDPVDLAPASTPVLGGGIAILSDGTTVAATDESGARLVLFDLTTGTERGEVRFEPFSQPQRIAEDGDGLVWVALRREGQVAAVDPSTATEVKRLAVCPAPRGLDTD